MDQYIPLSILMDGHIYIQVQMEISLYGVYDVFYLIYIDFYASMNGRNKNINHQLVKL